MGLQKFGEVPRKHVLVMYNMYIAMLTGTERMGSDAMGWKG